MDKESIQELLRTNDKAVMRAVVAIYKRQTAAEQGAEETLLENGVGFNAADAKRMTAYAKVILMNPSYEMYPPSLEDARQRIMKYSGQLLEIAAANEANRALQQLFAVPSTSSSNTTQP